MKFGHYKKNGYTALRSSNRGRGLSNQQSIKHNAKSIKSLSSSRKYTLRPEPRNRVASPKSMAGDHLNPYCSYLNKRIINDIRSVQDEDHEPINNLTKRGHGTLNVRACQNIKSPRINTHKLWSISSVGSISRGRTSYKSAGRSNSRSLSGKNRKYFSFNQPGLKNELRNYENYYTKHDLEKDLKYRASNYNSSINNDKENTNIFYNIAKPSQRPQYSYIEEETSMHKTLSDTNMSNLNKWESTSNDDSRDLKPIPAQFESNNVFHQYRNSMFQKYPMHEVHYNNQGEKERECARVEHEMNKIIGSISVLSHTQIYEILNKLAEKERQILDLSKNIGSHKNNGNVTEAYFDSYDNSNSKLTQLNMLKHNSKMANKLFKTPNFKSPASSTNDSKMSFHNISAIDQETVFKQDLNSSKPSILSKKY
jgi:hypothetical protein